MVCGVLACGSQTPPEASSVSAGPSSTGGEAVSVTNSASTAVSEGTDGPELTGTSEHGLSSTSQPSPTSTGNFTTGSTGVGSTGGPGGSTSGSSGGDPVYCAGFDSVYDGNIDLVFPEDKLPLIGVECVTGVIYAHDSVGDFLGLESLVRVEGGIDLWGLDSPGTITSLQGLNNLAYVGTLYIRYSALQSLSGLEALEETASTVMIYECPLLHSLAGLSALHTVGGSLYLSFWWDGWGFPALQDLGGLQALRTIKLGLEIADTNLKDLDELSTLESIGNGAAIRDNPLLPTCKVEEFLKGVQVGGGTVNENNMPDACSP